MPCNFMLGVMQRFLMAFVSRATQTTSCAAWTIRGVRHVLPKAALSVWWTWEWQGTSPSPCPPDGQSCLWQA
jgi:hypothetical protein